MGKLPFILSIPHGGTIIPVELKPYCLLSDKDILEDSDTFTIPIYNLENDIHSIVIQPIARAILDVNRPIEHRPPEYPDGIIKSETVNGQKIYKQDISLKPQYFMKVFESYNEYHNKIKNITEDKDVVLGIDCHSMLPEGPITSKDYGSKRPFFNLGNCNGESCSNELTYYLAESIISVFNLNESEVSINKPFSGGYITRFHGNNPIPWIQLEINRALYMKAPWFDSSTYYIDSEPLNMLKNKLRISFHLFYQKIIHLF